MIGGKQRRLAFYDVDTEMEIDAADLKTDDSTVPVPPMVSWFGSGCEPGSEPNATGANTVFSLHSTELVVSHRRYGTRGFLDLGRGGAVRHRGVGRQIWNVSCGQGSCNGAGPGCGFDSSGLLHGWEASLTAALDAAGPVFANDSIIGVFLGDELSSSVNIPWWNVSAVASYQWLGPRRANL
jgi:hypothetical protein